MQDAMESVTKLRNKKISTLVECETKKRLDNTSKNNQNQQQPNKRQNTDRAYTTRHGEKKHYSGSKPSSTNANTTNIQKGTGVGQEATWKVSCRAESSRSVPGAAPVARAPYRLAPFGIKDLLEQLKELSDKGIIRPSFLTMGSSSPICQKGG
nr:putative reverse transcriptase domain-containing protein [Tanacetum cinerariifolium]